MKLLTTIFFLLLTLTCFTQETDTPANKTTFTVTLQSYKDSVDVIKDPFMVCVFSIERELYMVITDHNTFKVSKEDNTYTIQFNDPYLIKRGKETYLPLKELNLLEGVKNVTSDANDKIHAITDQNGVLDIIKYLIQANITTITITTHIGEPLMLDGNFAKIHEIENGYRITTEKEFWSIIRAHSKYMISSMEKK